MMEKRGQVTIFIIVGIIIVGLVVLGIMLYPQIKTTLGIGTESPALFIQNCMQGILKESTDKVSLHGGSIEPELFILNENEKVEYLCYTNEYYKTCVVQQPLLKSHIEKEIKTDIEDEATDCFNSLENSYKKQGYGVDLSKKNMEVRLLPERVVANFNYTLTLTKTNTQRYDSFAVMLDNNLYQLTSIATSIVEWEASYGDYDIATTSTYYPNLKIEKTNPSEGTKIYSITDSDTKDKFQFAVRSGVLPAGV